MRVDEAGGDGEAVGVDRLGGGLVDAAGIAHGDDPPVPDTYVGPPAGRSGAVDERAALDQVVEHRPPRTGETRSILGGRHRPRDRTRAAATIEMSDDGRSDRD